MFLQVCVVRMKDTLRGPKGGNSTVQLISVVFEHSVLRVWEIYALENVCVIHCSIWTIQTINSYIYASWNVQTQLI